MKSAIPTKRHRAAFGLIRGVLELSHSAQLPIAPIGVQASAQHCGLIRARIVLIERYLYTIPADHACTAQTRRCRGNRRIIRAIEPPKRTGPARFNSSPRPLRRRPSRPRPLALRRAVKAPSARSIESQKHIDTLDARNRGPRCRKKRRAPAKWNGASETGSRDKSAARRGEGGERARRPAQPPRRAGDSPRRMWVDVGGGGGGIAVLSPPAARAPREGGETMRRMCN